jgi:hypothetical protein
MLQIDSSIATQFTNNNGGPNYYAIHFWYTYSLNLFDGISISKSSKEI